MTTTARPSLSNGLPLRAMTEEEVRAFVAFLERKADEYWSLSYAEGYPHDQTFRAKAKAFGEAKRGFLWTLDGLKPETGEEP